MIIVAYSLPNVRVSYSSGLRRCYIRDSNAQTFDDARRYVLEHYGSVKIWYLWKEPDDRKDHLD